MTSTGKVLLALVLGLLIGAALSATGNPSLLAIPGYVEPIGTMWVNALRMIMIPLVMSAVVVGINALPESAGVGRTGGRALAVCLAMLGSAAAFAVVVGPIAMSGLSIDSATVTSMRAAGQASETAVESARTLIGPAQWMIDLVPVNPVKAMADAAMLPLLVFTILFGLATRSIEAAHRSAILGAANAVLRISLTMVGWALAVAPIGVFALTIPLASRLGVSAAGAIVYYVVAMAAMLTSFMALLYLVAWTIGRQSPRAFARACAPAQAVAVSSRSSIVTLPAMLDGAAALGIPLPIRSFFLPLAAASFKAGSAIAIPVGVIFLARLHGISLDAGQLATIAIVGIATTFGIPGIPGGTIIVMVPVLVSAGLPVSAVGLLLGVDTIPDMFRTATHVTADMTAVTILARSTRRDEDAGPDPTG